MSVETLTPIVCPEGYLLTEIHTFKDEEGTAETVQTLLSQSCSIYCNPMCMAEDQGLCATRQNLGTALINEALKSEQI